MKKKSQIKRELLFKNSKPNIRPLDRHDIGWLWAAYQMGGFDLEQGMPQREFSDEIAGVLSHYQSIMIIEDKNGSFKDGYGPVAMVGATHDGWKMEPSIDFFPWATSRNILRAVVGFLHKARYDKEVGVCIIHALNDSLTLFAKVRTYGVLWPVGKIPSGNETGDDNLFYLRGRKPLEAR